ncbi:MAG: T9SS C-terminal target domain-containing protein [Cytophagales bacterium]|nr:MAG: T9SS C-terminal target domain-containing protein [Cytophagales bacterium]
MKNSIPHLLKIIFIYIFSVTKIFAISGKLLLVGGGTERDTPNSWSTPAFQWAINQSTNKKALILHYETTSTFYPTYMTGQCGALESKNLVINASNANLQATYDDIMNYDFIFFRGGDQSIYYSTYRNTKTAQAINDKFNAGGVIGGSSAGLHILSKIVYNAQDASVTPPETMINVSNTGITLKNDLFNLFPGYVFDSHVAERGRFPRTIGFMAKWFNDTNEKIKGITVDDLTAMGIGSDDVGTVFGTGSVGIYESKSLKLKPYSISGKLKTDSIQVTQLINGWKYNFTNQTITTSGVVSITSTFASETNKSTVILSGADDLANNSNFITHFVTKIGKTDFPIVIFTGTDTTLARSFKLNILSRGAKRCKIIRLIPAGVTVAGLIDTIKQTNKFLFIRNTIDQLNTAFTNTIIGTFLNKKIRAEGVAVGFVGNNARFAGKRVLSDNYITSGAAYDNLIRTTKGLGLLQNTLIFPNAYSNSNMYENTVSATPYFMVKDSVHFGIMLTSNSYLKYASKIDNKAYFTSDGFQPAIILQNKSSIKTGFSNITSGKTNGMSPRQIAGFEEMTIAFLDSNATFVAGQNVPFSIINDSLVRVITEIKLKDMHKNGFEIYPNPVNDILNFENNDFINLKIFDLTGNVLVEKTGIINQISVANLPKGIYFLEIKKERNIIRNKIIKN